MALTARRAIQYAEDRLGGPISGAVGGISVLNHAGVLMDGLLDWKYMLRTSEELEARTEISATGATYYTSGRVLEATGAFDDYTFVAGDYVILTLSGGSTVKVKVASRTDGDNLVLAESSLGNEAGVALDLNTARMALPSDFGQAVSLVDTNSLTHYAYASSLAEIEELKATDVVALGFAAWYAIQWEAVTANEEPTPILRFYPEPASAQRDRLTLTYRRRWVELTTDADIIGIPSWLEPLYLRIARAVASDYDGGTDLDQEVAKIQAGATFAAAKRRDQTAQRSLGRPIRTAVAPAQEPLTIGERLARSQTQDAFL